LAKIDTEAEKTTLAQLLEKFTSVRSGMKPSTVRTDASPFYLSPNHRVEKNGSLTVSKSPKGRWLHWFL